MTTQRSSNFLISLKRSASALLLITCSMWLSPAMAQESSTPFDPGLYAQYATTKAVVLLSANWGRQWKCGSFENAQLQFLAFDKNGAQKNTPDGKWDLLLKDDSILPSKKGFENYAYIVEPGEYLLTGFRIKVSKSSRDVGNFSGDRKSLLVDGKSKGGSFTVAAGEIVYVGHFALDCATAPMPWRFYPESRDDFDQYLDVVSNKFPGIDKNKVQFRLFETTVMGYPFSLP